MIVQENVTQCSRNFLFYQWCNDIHHYMSISFLCFIYILCSFPRRNEFQKSQLWKLK